jgi:hypothetical protein
MPLARTVIRVYYNGGMRRTKTTERWCAQHKQPRSECLPADRHAQPLRARDDLIAAVDEAAAAKGVTRNEFIETELEKAVGWSDDPGKGQDPVAALQAEVTRLRAELTRLGQRTKAPVPGTAVFLRPEPGAEPVFLQEIPQGRRP